MNRRGYCKFDIITPLSKVHPAPQNKATKAKMAFSLTFCAWCHNLFSTLITLGWPNFVPALNFMWVDIRMFIQWTSNSPLLPSSCRVASLRTLDCHHNRRSLLRRNFHLRSRRSFHLRNHRHRSRHGLLRTLGLAIIFEIYFTFSYCQYIFHYYVVKMN